MAPDEETKDEDINTTAGSVLEDAWNDVMGADSEEVPDENIYLKNEAEAKVPEAEAEDEAPEKETADAKEDSAEKVEEPEAAEEQTEAEEPDAQVESVEAPQHWSEADRQNFSQLPSEARDFLLRRHKEMEADYTKKSQENADSIKIGTALSESLDEDTANVLKSSGVTLDQFARNMVSWHKMSSKDPIGLIRALSQQLGVDPRAAFGDAQPQPQPAADGETATAPDPYAQRLQAIEANLHQRDLAAQQTMQTAAANEIAAFMSETTEKGEPAHPHFDKVRVKMGTLMQADSNLSMNDAYETAVLMDKDLRSEVMQTIVPQPTPEPTPEPVKIDTQKVREADTARKALKMNKRSTASSADVSPAEKPMLSLRDAINSAADEVGLTP